MTNLETLINNAMDKLDKASSIARELDLVQWISPAGDLYIEPKANIDEMIVSGSWK